MRFLRDEWVFHKKNPEMLLVWFCFLVISLKERTPSTDTSASLTRPFVVGP